MLTLLLQPHPVLPSTRAGVLPFVHHRRPGHHLGNETVTFESSKLRAMLFCKAGSVSATKGKAEGKGKTEGRPTKGARLIAQTCKLMTQSEAEVPTVTAHSLELAHRLKASSVVHVWAQAAGDSEQPAGDSLNQWREPAKDLQTLGAGNCGNSWTHVSH